MTLIGFAMILQRSPYTYAYKLVKMCINLFINGKNVYNNINKHVNMYKTHVYENVSKSA